VIARAVAERVAVPVRETRDDEHVLAERFERLQDPRELERLAIGLRRPVDHRDAVGDVDESEAQRRLFRGKPPGS
jgi:hypothetical protein